MISPQLIIIMLYSYFYSSMIIVSFVIKLKILKQILETILPFKKDFVYVWSEEPPNFLNYVYYGLRRRFQTRWTIVY